MNKIQIVSAAALVALAMTSAVLAADETRSVVPAPPVAASQQPANDAAAKSRAARLRQRNLKAKSLSGTEKITVDPTAPATAETSVPKKTPAADASAAKRVNKLKDRNVKARAKSLPKETATPKDKVATPSAK